MPTMPKHIRRPWEPAPIPYNKMQGQGRKAHNQKFYNSKEWKAVVKLMKVKQPLCIDCLKENKTTPGYVTDHIRPINPINAYDTQGGRYPHPLDINNLQRLCDRCHNKKSAQERHGK